MQHTLTDRVRCPQAAGVNPRSSGGLLAESGSSQTRRSRSLLQYPGEAAQEAPWRESRRNTATTASSCSTCIRSARRTRAGCTPQLNQTCETRTNGTSPPWCAVGGSQSGPRGARTSSLGRTCHHASGACSRCPSWRSAYGCRVARPARLVIPTTRCTFRATAHLNRSTCRVTWRRWAQRLGGLLREAIALRLPAASRNEDASRRKSNPSSTRDESRIDPQPVPGWKAQASAASRCGRAALLDGRAGRATCAPGPRRRPS